MASTAAVLLGTFAMGKVYATPTGFRIGSKGKVQVPGSLYAGITDKGARRQLRKAARSAGFGGHASAR